MSSIVQHGLIEFSRSILDGVEIKLCRNAPHAYKPHVHKELSLGYIVEGSTELALSDRTIHYGPGDGVIIPPLMTHRCAPKDPDHWAYVMLFLKTGIYSDAVRFSRAKKLTAEQARILKSFIDQLLTEESQDTLESILVELLVEFSEKDLSDRTCTAEDERIEWIRDYILTHVSDAISLDELQRMSGLNKFSIIRHFKKRYVTTPAAFHLQHRVAEAKRLIGQGLDIFDICDRLGFYDQAHLIREFKKMYGVTPVAYTRQTKA